jgi:hypothetical protein
VISFARGDTQLQRNDQIRFIQFYFNEASGDITLDEKDGYTKILPVDSEGKFRVCEKRHLHFSTIESRGNQYYENRTGQLKVQII